MFHFVLSSGALFYSGPSPSSSGWFFLFLYYNARAPPKPEGGVQGWEGFRRGAEIGQGEIALVMNYMASGYVPV